MSDKTLSIKKRYRAERRFVFCAKVCVAAAILFLGGLFADIAGQGWRGFLGASLRLTVFIDAAVIGDNSDQKTASYGILTKRAFRERFPAATRKDRKHFGGLLSFAANLQLRERVRKTPALIGQRVTVWLAASALAESYLKGNAAINPPEERRKLKDAHIVFLDDLKKTGDAKVHFNRRFFSAADSTDSELAGILGALKGTAYTLLLAFLFSFPTAVLAAIYLELLAPRNRWFDLIEININNLAAVPSVIFGLLGLAVLINMLHLPRGTALVGGLVLSLMTMPTMIIAARAAIVAVPRSLLAAALSLGATKIQAIFHHVLPAAMPGVLTGAIIGMARALGESAPLLMIGMVAFINKTPNGFTDSATVLPVQIYLWAEQSGRGFAEKTAAATLVLLLFLAAMNLAAVLLRKKLEIKW